MGDDPHLRSVRDHRRDDRRRQADDLLRGIVAVTGLLIGLRQGRLWTSIVALVFAVVTVLIGFADLGNISQLYGPAKDFPDSVFSVGFGLWLVLIGGVAGLVLSIVAMVRRPELAPQH
jgi:uncharacterized membrane protein